MVGGGSSSSLMIATSFGTALGAISLPASNWRGMTFTTFTGAAAAGGGGGGGGGGGATRKLVNWLFGKASKYTIGMMMATPSSNSCPMKETSTVHVLLVFPTPSTNDCSNIKVPFQVSPRRAVPTGAPRAPFPRYLSAFVFLAAAAGGFTADTAAGATALFLASAQLCHSSTIGLATKIDEYEPIIMPTTSANENVCNTVPPNRYNASTVRNVNPEVMIVLLSVWLMLRFISSARGSRRLSFKFSRIRSKITIVSFIE